MADAPLATADRMRGVLPAREQLFRSIRNTSAIGAPLDAKPYSFQDFEVDIKALDTDPAASAKPTVGKVTGRAAKAAGTSSVSRVSTQEPAMSLNASTTSATTAPMHLTVTTSWFVFSEFAAPAVEREYRRYRMHGYFWPSIFTYAATGALCPLVLSLAKHSLSVEMAIYAFAVFAFTSMTLILLMSLHRPKSVFQEHVRVLLVETIESISRPTLSAFAFIFVTSSRPFAGCPRPAREAPDRCPSSLSSTMVIYVWFHFAFVQNPKQALVGAALLHPVNIIAMLLEPDAFSAWLVALRGTYYFIITIVLLILSIALDRRARRAFSDLAATAFADREFALYRLRLANVVRAALPSAVASRLALATRAALPQDAFYDAHPNATVCITGAVDFSSWSSHRLQITVMAALHHLFSIFDEATSLFGVDQATTFGDEYVVTSGLIRGRNGDTGHAARFALWQLMLRENQLLQLRSAIATGPLMGGLVGSHSLRYVLAGEAMSTVINIIRRTKPQSLYVAEATAMQLRKNHPDAFHVADIDGLTGVYEVTLHRGGGPVSAAAAVAAAVETAVTEEPLSEEALARAAYALAPQADAQATFEPWQTQNRSSLQWCTLSALDPADEAAFYSFALEELRDNYSRYAAGLGFLFLLMTIAEVVSLDTSVEGTHADGRFTGTVVIFLACMVLMVLAATLNHIFTLRWGVRIPYAAMVALTALVQIAGAIGIGISPKSFVTNDPYFYACVQLTATVALLCRPMNSVLSIAYVMITLVGPVAYLGYQRLSAKAASPSMIFMLVFFGAIAECRSKGNAFRSAFLRAREADIKMRTTREALDMLTTMVGQIVPLHMVEPGIAALEREAVGRILSGDNNKSRVAQFQSIREVFHEIETIEDMADFVVIQIRLSGMGAIDWSALNSATSDGNEDSTTDLRRLSNGSGMKRFVPLTSGHGNDAHLQVAHSMHTSAIGQQLQQQRNLKAQEPPSSDSALLTRQAIGLRSLPTQVVAAGPRADSLNFTNLLIAPDEAAARHERARQRRARFEEDDMQVLPLDILYLYESISKLIVRVGEGSLHLLQALGDDMTVGGPFGRRPGDRSIRQAATSAILMLRALHLELDLRFTAFVTLDEANGALMGRGALRYRVFGQATRQSLELLQGAPIIRGSTFAAACRSVIRCVAPSLVRTPLSKREELQWQEQQWSKYFLPQQRWAVKTVGLTYVFPICMDPLIPGENRRYDSNTDPRSVASDKSAPLVDFGLAATVAQHPDEIQRGGHASTRARVDADADSDGQGPDDSPRSQ
jgi:class 3 adenylate cyclase